LGEAVGVLRLAGLLRRKDVGLSRHRSDGDHAHPEDDENLEIVRLPVARALEMIEAGEIEDAKTIIGLTLAAARLGLETG
jgi:hypothetical protein